MGAMHHQETFWSKYIFSVDHKIIGFQYLLTGMFMALIGGFFAYAFRMQLAFPGQNVPGYGLVSSGEYNMLVTSHGTIMVFWVAMPILLAAFGNWLIPLMIGCDDMVFPRLNRLSYQIFLLSAVVLIISFFVPGGAFGGSWVAYPPLSAVADYNLTPWGSVLWLLAVALEFVAFLIGGINFVTTLMNSRAPGMRLIDIPMVLWMIVIASVLFMASVGPLMAGAVMLLFDQLFSIGFYDPSKGGDPILWQHLFWFFGHPEVYIVLFPALGVVAEVITTFARKKLFAYRVILASTIAVSVLGMFVWAHHQFIAGIDPRVSYLFTITTVMISVPLTVMMISYIATLFKGSIQLQTPMLFALSFIGSFLLGGVTGIPLGASGADIFLHDTYYVVAHFHYTFFPIAIIGAFTGIYYWYPKFVGRHMSEFLGKVHFWGTFIPFNLIFLPLFVLGVGGQHRRIYNFQHFEQLSSYGYQNLRMVATFSLVVMLLFQIVFLYNFFASMKKGKKASKNPWKANTLEWTAESPPPHGNFPVFPSVYRGPYEFSVPGRKNDYWPQNEK